MKNNIKNNKIIKQLLLNTCIIAILLFFLSSFLFLTRYPLSHIDEAWMSNTTKNLFRNGSMELTIYKCRDNREGYYFGKLFLISQQFFFKIFGYSLLAARLVSFLSIIGCSIIFFLIMRDFGANKSFSCFFTFIFLTTEQVVYSSHLARPEAMFTFWFLLCLFIFLKKHSSKKWYDHFIIGILCGIGFEIHLLALLLCLTVFILYLYYDPCESFNVKINKTLPWISGVILLIILWFLGRFCCNNRFFNKILSYASNKSLEKNLITRIKDFFIYYYRIFWGNPYHSKCIDIAFIMFVVIFSIFIINKRNIDIDLRKRCRLLLLILISINIGFFLLGRYNRHYIIVIYPFVIMLGLLVLSGVINYFDKKIAIVLIILFLLFPLINIGKNAYLFYIFRNSDFDNYMKRIKENIPPKKTVIGDLSYEYGFHDYDYISIHDLTYAFSKKMEIENYFCINKIEYIIYTQYWDYMCRNQIDYGAIDYTELKTFLENRCQLIENIQDHYYGMTHQYWGNCWTKIYKVRYE